MNQVTRKPSIQICAGARPGNGRSQSILRNSIYPALTPGPARRLGAGIQARRLSVERDCETESMALALLRAKHQVLTCWMVGAVEYSASILWRNLPIDSNSSRWTILDHGCFYHFTYGILTWLLCWTRILHTSIVKTNIHPGRPQYMWRYPSASPLQHPGQARLPPAAPLVPLHAVS